MGFVLSRRFWFEAAITEGRYQVNRFPSAGDHRLAMIQQADILMFIGSVNGALTTGLDR
jgi:hypothetical protein